MPSEKIIIYCDGACSGNQFEQNVGGWGAVLQYKDRVKEIYGGEKNTTNNRMELTACIKALEQVKLKNAEIEIYCDSAYIVNCFRQGWHLKWQRNGWMTSKKEPVENRDLWERLISLADQHQVTFQKVKGHAGVELNERADQLANRGMAEAEKNPSQSPVANRPSPIANRPSPIANRQSKITNASPDPRLDYRAVEGGYLLRLPRGARVMETLLDFIREKNIDGGALSAIGAVEEVELGYFRLSDHQYLRKKLNGIYELVAFSGNVSYVDGQPMVHAHAVLGDPGFQTVAGHFFDGAVAVTMEIYLTVFSDKIARRRDEETGLNLLDL